MFGNTNQNTVNPETIEGYFQLSGDEYVPLPQHQIVLRQCLSGERWFCIACHEDDELDYSVAELQCEKNLGSNNILNGEPFLRVSIATQNHFPIFNRIIAEIIDEGCTAQQTVTKLRQYAEIFSRPDGEMDILSATGLFGELYFMHRWMDADLEAMIEAWSGPSASHKDFSWDDLQVEVKTTGSEDQPRTHTISSLGQLVEEGRPLFLFSMCARADVGGEESLCGLIEEIRGLVDGETLDTFNDMLLQYGYTDENPENDHFVFSLTQGDGEIYRVADGFPRLLPPLLDGGIDVDERVHVSQYTITLTNIDAYQIHVGPGLTLEHFHEYLD